MMLTKEGLGLINACEDFMALARNNCATEADCNMALFYGRQLQDQLSVREQCFEKSWVNLQHVA